MIADPLSLPGVKYTRSCWSPVTVYRAVGTAGGATGVAVTVDDAGLVPTAFTAFNCTLYDVSFVKPVIVTEETAPVAGLNGVKVAPLSIEYW